jgi:hypothetical protein
MPVGAGFREIGIRYMAVGAGLKEVGIRIMPATSSPSYNKEQPLPADPGFPAVG